MNNRPLYGLERFSTTIAKHLNDLPITGPHGSDFDATRKLSKLHRFQRSARHSDGTPQQVLRHSSDFRVIVKRKTATQTFRKQCKIIHCFPKSGSPFSVGSCGGKHRLQGQIRGCWSVASPSSISPRTMGSSCRCQAGRSLGD
jgi:hypothetical protein